MYAIIKTGGKQYKVSEGDEIYVEKLDLEDGAAVDFEVLMVEKDAALIKFSNIIIWTSPKRWHSVTVIMILKCFSTLAAVLPWQTLPMI